MELIIEFSCENSLEIGVYLLVISPYVITLWGGWDGISWTQMNSFIRITLWFADSKEQNWVSDRTNTIIYIYHNIYICLLQLLPQNNSGSDGKYPRYPIKIGMAFTRCYDHKKMSISQSTNNVTTIRANLSNTLHIWRIYIRWNICTHTFAYSKLCVYI